MIVNALLFAVVVSFVLPVLLAFAFSKINEDKVSGFKLTIVFVLGSIAYLIAEILIKDTLIVKEILPALVETDWYYIIFEKTTYVSAFYYSLFMGTVTALLQESFRFLVFYIAYITIKEANSVKVPLVYGFGSGLADAMVYLGIMAFTYIAQIGTEDSVLTDAGAARVIYAAIERVIHLFYQAGYAMLIVYGIKNKKKILMTLLTVLLHAVLMTVDLFVGKLGAEYTMLNSMNALLATAVFGGSFMLWKNAFKKKTNIDKKS